MTEIGVVRIVDDGISFGRYFEEIALHRPSSFRIAYIDSWVLVVLSVPPYRSQLRYSNLVVHSHVSSSLFNSFVHSLSCLNNFSLSIRCLATLPPLLNPSKSDPSTSTSFAPLSGANQR